MLARLGTERLGDQTLGDRGELEDSSGGRRIKERWAGVHLWGDRLEEKSDEVRHKDVHRGEGTKASTHPIHDATRNSPFCHRGPDFSGAGGGHGLKFHWRVPVMGPNGTDMYSCTA